MAGERADVDEHAGALLPEARERRLRAVDHSEHVRLEDAPERLGRHLLEAAEDVDGGVVHPDVDATEPRDRGVAQALDGGLDVAVGPAAPGRAPARAGVAGDLAAGGTIAAC